MITLAIGLGVVGPVYATPITYDFTVTGTNGPLAGVVSNGKFSYDSNSVVNGFNTSAGLLTKLSFVWDGKTYTAADANTGALKWDASGNLLLAFFGTNCTAGACTTAIAGKDVWLTRTNGLFDYRTPTSGLSHGTFTFAPAHVPEPGTLGLFLAALGLGVLGSKRKFGARQ